MRNPDSLKEYAGGNFVENPKIHGQGVFTINRFPINEDYIAVSQATSQLLKEGWNFKGIVKEDDKYFIELNREWKC
jgi:hypothetical protein